MTPPPEDIQLIGKEIAIRWPDGREDYFDPEYLRAHSPSAENIGEKDIFGNQYGGKGSREFPGVTVDGWKYAGNYAVVFTFSDGHNTGIYAWDTLRKLGDAQQDI
ncbi:DUF971 domain-containing protein [Ruficoccus amylovorans]|uniref:DUF971 domain-containing protein n=1 Tax=Ruficoccus amylovorans TaxID=1804625 RepID=A0A842HDM3_9BACT|nr:DUF971 domain-containing protein [Ruficoccus amylovorans]MBC2593687.1 DUF971 domain-containing protein [Ruficoccus amylovorans]